MSDAVQLIANTCPARLNDPEDIYAGNVKKYRSRLRGYLTRCVSKGVRTGEFEQVPAEETAILIISVTKGIVRYRNTNRVLKKNSCKAAIDFCRRSLMNDIDRESWNRKIY